jgi:hypothetical protein
MSGKRNGIGDESTRKVAGSHGRGECAVTLQSGKVHQVPKGRQKFLVRRGIYFLLESVRKLVDGDGLERADPFPLQRKLLEASRLAGAFPKCLETSTKTS